MRFRMMVFFVCGLVAFAQSRVGYKLKGADLFLKPPQGFILEEPPAKRFVLFYGYPHLVTYWSGNQSAIEIREAEKPLSCPDKEEFASAVESIHSIAGIRDLQTSKADGEIGWKFRRVASNTPNIEVRVILRSFCWERSAVLVQGLVYGADKGEVDKIAERVVSAVRMIELKKRAE